MAYLDENGLKTLWAKIGTKALSVTNNAVSTHNTSTEAHGDIRTAISGKQDSISDLADIRSGAALGATALQSYTETDPTVPSWVKNESIKPNAARLYMSDDETTIQASFSELNSNFNNYYKKSATYSKTEVDNLISSIEHFEVVVAESLPTASATYKNKLYVIPKTSGGSGADYSDEYLCVLDSESDQYQWEHIGSTTVDLSAYQLAETAVTHTKNTAAGSTTQPVYIDANGVATATGYTLAQSVTTSSKLTDTVTTATTSGSGNAVTAITANNGALTVTKGSTFLTSHQDISGKADKATTLAGYGITDGVTVDTKQSITGEKTFMVNGWLFDVGSTFEGEDGLLITANADNPNSANSISVTPTNVSFGKNFSVSIAGFFNGFAVSSYARLASPTFTGTPKAPTAKAGTNTTQIATTEFVTTAVSGKQDSMSPIADSVINALD